jgi:hypothetical protein
MQTELVRAWHKRKHSEPLRFELRDAAGKLLAQVEHTDGGHWRWQRFTTIASAPPAAGFEPECRTAMKRACPDCMVG